MHVGALQVFDELEFEALRIGEFADARGNRFHLGEFRSALPPRSCHEFIRVWFSVGRRAHQDRLQYPVQSDVVRQFSESCFIKLASGICLRFLNTGERYVPH